MEFLQKQFLQIMTTGTTSGCTGNCRIIIPDTGATYNFKFLLSSNAKDIGFFDAFTDYYAYGGYDNEDNAFGMGEDLLLDDSYI